MPKKESIKNNSNRRPKTPKNQYKKNGKPGLKHEKRIKAR